MPPVQRHDVLTWGRGHSPTEAVLVLPGVAQLPAGISQGLCEARNLELALLLLLLRCCLGLRSRSLQFLHARLQARLLAA